jgi:hypothetical protein
MNTDKLLLDDKVKGYIHPSDSGEQQQAEMVIADLLEKSLELCLERNKRLDFNNSYVDVDLFCESPAIVAEIYAHIGRLKVAQFNKLATDAFKMLYIERMTSKSFRKMIVVCDGEVFASLNGGSWKASAIREFGIEIKKINITDDLKTKIINAQKRQYR